MKVEKKIKRLVVNLTEQDHKNLKKIAIDMNVTLSNLTLKALYFFIENFVKE